MTGLTLTKSVKKMCIRDSDKAGAGEKTAHRAVEYKRDEEGQCRRHDEKCLTCGRYHRVAKSGEIQLSLEHLNYAPYHLHYVFAVHKTHGHKRT